MNVVAIVQARLGSSRLPAKILLDLGGQTALQRCLDRVARIERVSAVVVATSVRPEDDIVESVARRLGYQVSRGSEQDVLSRYHHAASTAGADVVVRTTSDCPLLDPSLSSKVVREFLETQATTAPLDYASNTLERRLPRGLDTEVFGMKALTAAHQEATSVPEREHVTMYMYRNQARFRCFGVSAEGPDESHQRWTLDTVEDYHFLFKVFEQLGAKAGSATMADVLSLVRSRDDLANINSNIRQKSV